jgi:hypothetical protein
MPDENTSPDAENQEIDRAEYDRLRAAEEQYQAQLYDMQRERDQYAADAQRAEGWDRWWNDNVAPHYADPEQFTRDMSNEWLGRRGQQNYQPEPDAGRASMDEQVPNDGRYSVNGLEEDDFVNYGQVQGQFRQQEEHFNNAVRQGFEGLKEEMRSEIYNKIAAEMMPTALDSYDRALWVRLNHADDEGFEWDQLVGFARQNGIADMEQAYNMLYGERDYNAALDQAREEGAAQREEEIKTQQEKDGLNVLTGNPVPRMLGTRELEGPTARKSAIMEELHGRGIQ